MDMESLFDLKRKSFWERIETFKDFTANEIKRGALLGRVGKPAVGPEQLYRDNKTGEWNKVLMFGSNSYLGFPTEPFIKDAAKKAIDSFGLGSGGSPAFSGYMIQQLEVEQRLAMLSDHEEAILVASGYMANLAWISALMERDDILIYDRNSHASTIDAMHLSGIRHAYRFNTDDLETLDASIKSAKKNYPSSQIFLTIEGVRSIDGSVVNLEKILELIKPYGSSIFVVLDDAHGLGTLGKRGFGTMEYLDLQGRVDLRMSTCSKAFGIQGAFLTGKRNVINYIRSISNPYTFTTAPSQPVLAAIDAALTFLIDHPERVALLQENKRYLKDRLTESGFNILNTPGGVIPIFIPGHPCDELNRELFESGLFCNVFAYPLVSPGQERIRLSIMATHTKEHLDKAHDILQAVGRRRGILAAKTIAA